MFTDYFDQWKYIHGFDYVSDLVTLVNHIEYSCHDNLSKYIYKIKKLQVSKHEHTQKATKGDIWGEGLRKRMQLLDGVFILFIGYM